MREITGIPANNGRLTIDPTVKVQNHNQHYIQLPYNSRNCWTSLKLYMKITNPVINDSVPLVASLNAITVRFSTIKPYTLIDNAPIGLLDKIYNKSHDKIFGFSKE